MIRFDHERELKEREGDLREMPLYSRRESFLQKKTPGLEGAVTGKQVLLSTLYDDRADTILKERRSVRSSAILCSLLGEMPGWRRGAMSPERTKA